jgi:hypothetical protein
MENLNLNLNLEDKSQNTLITSSLEKFLIQIPTELLEDKSKNREKFLIEIPRESPKNPQLLINSTLASVDFINKAIEKKDKKNNNNVNKNIKHLQLMLKREWFKNYLESNIELNEVYNTFKKGIEDGNLYINQDKEGVKEIIEGKE